MIRFDEFKRAAWSALVICTVAFALGGCDGDDGQDGTPGATGDSGLPGADGQACWDLNGNGVGDLPDEDINGDGVVDVLDCSAGADAIGASIDKAQVESCGTCHDGVGDQHQGIYNQYKDASNFGLTFDDLSVVAAAGGGFDLTLDFSITKNGQPYIDPVGSPPSVTSTSFYIAEYDSGAGEFYNSVGGFAFGLSASNAASNGDGTYTLAQNVAVDPTAFAGGAIVGRIADGPLNIEDDQAAKRVRLYADYAAASWPIGDIGTYTSAANVEACEACHGAPYRKHGNSPGMVAGVPDFTYCRGCHNNTANGGHKEWQHMVDDPFAWATGQALTAEQDARYGYERTLQQDVHMSHALEFPYPQSIANCNTCHEGKLDAVLMNDNFQMETCQGCHVIEGIDAWPDDLTGSGDEGKYYQPHRAPAFAYLWRRDSDLTFHESLADPDCTQCHGNPAVGAPAFADYHTGYDPHIYDPTGIRYADAYTVSIDNVTYDNVNYTMTVEFSASDPAIVPELFVSFYGWDTKHFLVGSHERDSNDVDCPHSRRPGCNAEYVPESSGGGFNPLFTEDAASAPGAWIVTFDMNAWQLYKTDMVPDLIAAGDITKAEISLAPELNLGGTEVVLEAVSDTFDLNTNAIIANYFADANEIVDIDKCNACHDALASTFHSGSGRGGDGVQVCRACHTTTFPGSHVEMASRSIDNYVHAIHSFQAFDPGDTFEEFDPVFAKRYDLHVGHTLPYFTALACEACHTEGTYNVPDQTQSMPGVLSAADDIATWYGIDAVTDGAFEDPAGRNIGAMPEMVTGPASRSCGGCHRADMINADHAGDLASFNAHTEAFGTFVENDSDDAVVFGIIDKIMTWFE